MRKGRNYDVYEGVWRAASKREWAAWVKAGKSASISQAVGVFGSNNELLRVCTERFRVKGHPAGEWASRICDWEVIDLLNPLYCPPGSTPEEIEAMHAQALSKARAFVRSYVERDVHYSENIEEATDPRYLAKTCDFAVDYFEEEGLQFPAQQEDQHDPFQGLPEKDRRCLIVLSEVIKLINSQDLSVEDRAMIIANALADQVSRERGRRGMIHNISVPRVFKEFQRIWTSMKWPGC
jgi:hypothetical protein